ncbi:MAG: asparaginase [Burkholderiaceae bacterium]
MEVHRPRSRVVVLGTGGTIAGQAEKASDNLGYRAGALTVVQLLQAVPTLQVTEADVLEVAQVDSKDMGLAVWQRLLQQVQECLSQEDVQGVVITHGTDTIEETAFLLQWVLRPKKPVVMVCAMRPATAVSPDGPQNLLDAMAVATSPDLAGVVVVCGGRVHGALDVRKVHPYRLDPFSSGDAGVLGQVEEGRLRWFRRASVTEGDLDKALLEAVLAADALPRVYIVPSYADVDPQLLRLMLAPESWPAEQPLLGLVVEATGNGTVHDRLLPLLNEARRRGIAVALASRCSEGAIASHPGIGFEAFDGLSVLKTRLALALGLMGKNGSRPQAQDN